MKKNKAVHKENLGSHYPIDNNRSERVIKTIFHRSEKLVICEYASRCKGSSIIYSVIETAKKNGLNPFKVLDALDGNTEVTPLTIEGTKIEYQIMHVKDDDMYAIKIYF